jgi:hypothetical protein
MSRTVSVELKVNLLIRLEDSVDLDDVLTNMDYDFDVGDEGAELIRSEIIESTVKDV